MFVFWFIFVFLSVFMFNYGAKITTISGLCKQFGEMDVIFNKF